MAKLKAHGQELCRMVREMKEDPAKEPDMTVVRTYAFMSDGAILKKVAFRHDNGSHNHDTGWLKVVLNPGKTVDSLKASLTASKFEVRR